MERIIGLWMETLNRVLLRVAMENTNWPAVIYWKVPQLPQHHTTAFSSKKLPDISRKKRFIATASKKNMSLLRWPICFANDKRPHCWCFLVGINLHQPDQLTPRLRGARPFVVPQIASFIRHHWGRELGSGCSKPFCGDRYYVPCTFKSFESLNFWLAVKMLG